MKKQSKYRGAHTAVGASGLALIMGLVNVAVAADVSIAVTKSPTSVGNVVVTSNAATQVGTPQFFRSQVTADIVGSPVNISNAEGNVTVADNTLSAAAGGNEALSETTVESYTDIGDFSISSAQASVMAGSWYVNASLDSDLVTILFSAPVTNAVVTGNTALAAVTANRSMASIEQLDMSGFETPTTDSSVEATWGASNSAIDVAANGIITNFQHAGHPNSRVDSSASVTGAAILVDTAASASSLDEGMAITISDNQMTASYGANDSSSQYTGSGSDFGGSLAIANFQNNVSGGVAMGSPQPASASIKGSGVTVDLGNNAIDGDVTISGQEVWADSSGNTAANVMSLSVDNAIAGGSGVATANAVASATDLTASAENSTIAIASAQRNQGVRLESLVSDSHITVNGRGGDGEITVHDNSSRASATGNTVTNELFMGAVSAIDGAGAVVANAQLNSDTTVRATNDSNIGITSPTGFPTYGFSTHAGPVVFSGNTLGASAVGNTASNLSQVFGGDINSGTAVVTSNSQSSAGGSVTAETTSDIGATQLLGEFTVRIPFFGNRTLIDGAESADMVLAGNTIDSSSKVNVATNSTLITAGSSEHSGSITNQQVSSTTSSATTLGTLGVGLISVDEPEIDLTLSGNTISAWASGNEATNELINHATTLSVGGNSFLNNAQTSSGTISSNAGTTADPLELGVTVIGHVDGAVNVLGNKLKSAAAANSARNAVEFEAVTAFGVADNGMSLSNVQTSESTLTSTTEGSVLIEDGSIQFETGSSILNSILNAAVPTLLPAEVNGKVNVIDNRLQAFGTQNEAFNTLTLAAGSAEGTARLNNAQTSSGATNVMATSSGVGVATEGFFGGGSIDGAVTVTDNKVQSQAIANLATNTLSVASSTGSAAVGSLTNTQTSSGPVHAETVLNGRIGVTANGLLRGSSTVGGNTASALAVGNNANNVLNADGGAGALAGNLVSTNMQSNAGAISSSVSGNTLSGPAIGVTMARGSTGYTANVLGSNVSSVAYGNSAQNTLNASSMAGATASASLISSQSNSGAVTARVSNAGVGIVGRSTVSGAGRSVIAGNTISATAVGNSSVSQMMIGR